MTKGILAGLAALGILSAAMPHRADAQMDGSSKALMLTTAAPTQQRPGGDVAKGNLKFTIFANLEDPVAINFLDVISGSYADAQGVSQGFVRAPWGTVSTFNVSGDLDTVVTSMNEIGVITGFSDVAFYGTEGFVLDPIHGITTFRVPGALSETNPAAINLQGTITGNYQDYSSHHGFLRTRDGAITTFDPPGSLPFDILGQSGTLPHAINSEGAITGTFQIEYNFLGFLRASDGTFTVFDSPDGEAGPHNTTPPASTTGGKLPDIIGLELGCVLFSGNPTALLKPLMQVPIQTAANWLSQRVSMRRESLLDFTSIT